MSPSHDSQTDAERLYLKLERRKLLVSNNASNNSCMCLHISCVCVHRSVH